MHKALNVKTYSPITLFLILIMFSQITFSQQAPPSALLQALRTKNYAQCITSAPAELAKANPFITVTGLAIALDKTKRWNEHTTEPLKSAFSKAPAALAQVKALRKLLVEDMSGMTELFATQEVSPAAEEIGRAGALLTAHGYALAATALRVLDVALFQAERVQAWLKIPITKRKAIDTLMEAHYPVGSINRRMLAEAAMTLALNPPVGSSVTAAEYLALARQLGAQDGVVSYDAVQRLFTAGKVEEAKALAKSFASAAPTDAAVQLRLAAISWPIMRDEVGAITIYRNALASVPEPECRKIRQAYPRFLLQLRKSGGAAETLANANLSTLRFSKNPLEAGEILLAEKRFAEAAEKFRLVLDDKNAKLANKLAAWIALLDADPSAALAQGTALVQSIAQRPKTERAVLVDSLLRAIWNNVNYDIPLAGGRYRTPPPVHLPISSVKGWTATLVSMITPLLAENPDICLQPRQIDNLASLRLAIAALYAFNGDAQQSYHVISQPYAYNAPPPPAPGGWRNANDPAGDKMIKVTSPRPGEAEKMLSDIAQLLTRSAQGIVTGPEVDGALAKLLVAQMASNPTEQAAARQRALAALLVESVTTLDPPPANLRTDQPPPPYNQLTMARFAPMQQALTTFINNDTLIKGLNTLLTEGLTTALTTAAHPDLLDALTTLTGETLLRHNAVSQPKNTLASDRKWLINHLSGRQIYDMQPYIKRLEELK